MHPGNELFGLLIGKWSGRGHGEYPTVESFDYVEHLEFWSDGRPFLHYLQQTESSADGRKLHSEAGFWRSGQPGRVELIVAHSTGIVEIAEGTFSGATIDLTSTAVSRSGTAKEVTAVRRQLTIDGGVIGYTTTIAAVGEPLTLHLAGELARTGN